MVAALLPVPWTEGEDGRNVNTFLLLSSEANKIDLHYVSQMELMPYAINGHRLIYDPTTVFPNVCELLSFNVVIQP